MLTVPRIGVAVRLWQLGIEMRPLFNRTSLWVYPIYAGVGASFGYWMEDIAHRQRRILAERKDKLLERRKRRAEREARKGAEGQFDGAVQEPEEHKPGEPIVVKGSAWGK